MVAAGCRCGSTSKSSESELSTSTQSPALDTMTGHACDVACVLVRGCFVGAGVAPDEEVVSPRVRWTGNGGEQPVGVSML